MAEGDGRPLLLLAVQTGLPKERPREDMMRRCLLEVGSRRSQDMIGHKLEGSLLVTSLMVVVVHGHSDEEVEEGDLPCAAAACRKHQVRIRDEVGSQ